MSNDNGGNGGNVGNVDPKEKVLEMYKGIQEQYGDDFPIMVVSLIARAKRQEDLLVQIGETVGKIGGSYTAMKVVNHIRSLLKTVPLT